MRCDCCTSQIYYAEEVIVLRYGIEVSCRKKHSGTFFKSYLYDDDRRERVFHLKCIRDVFDMSDAEEHDTMQDCALCQKGFPAREMFFQFLPGKMDSAAQDGASIRIERINNAAVRCFYACYDCVVDGFTYHLGSLADAYEVLGITNKPDESTDSQPARSTRHIESSIPRRRRL